MSWVQRVRELLIRREPVPPEQREAIRRADRLLTRADRVIAEIRHLDKAPH